MSTDADASSLDDALLSAMPQARRIWLSRRLQKEHLDTHARGSIGARVSVSVLRGCERLYDDSGKSVDSIAATRPEQTLC